MDVVGKTHPENKQSNDDGMFSTMAPNIGPVRDVDQRRETGYHSGHRSAVNMTPLESDRSGGERESILLTGTHDRNVTFRKEWTCAGSKIR